MKVTAEIRFTAPDPATGEPCVWVSRRVRDEHRESTITEPLEET